MVPTQAIILWIQVNAVLVIIQVARLSRVPIRVRQGSARCARYKRSLRRSVSAVDVYIADSFACKQKSHIA